MKNRIILLALFLSLAGISTQVLAAKTDIIILQNGDHITGEIKGLVSGQLELSTEYMDTVFIDWENIRDIISNQGQQIEKDDGERLLGTLDKRPSYDPEDADKLVINTEEGPIEVDSANVVRMYPIGGGFWDRMDLRMGIGFNYDKSSDVGKYNFGMDAVYRAPEFITFGKFVAETTTQNTVDDTTRNVLNLEHMTYRPNKRYIGYFGSMEENDQLGVKLRTLLGSSYGFRPLITGRNWLSLGVGLAVNRERPFDGTESDNNLEGVGTIRYQYFKHSTPERLLDVSFKVFPSITQWGRVRYDFSVDAQWEIVHDFYIGLEFYSSYDGEPAAAEAGNIDFGYRTTVGIKF